MKLTGCISGLILFIAVVVGILQLPHFHNIPLDNLLQGPYDLQRLIPSLEGQVAIITGANIGLGLGTAEWLAKRDATIIFACRNEKKAKKAMEKIKSKTSSAKLEFIHVDLQDLKTVDKFVSTFLEKYSRLDMLVNNAAIMGSGFELTDFGVEKTIMINHLGPSYLTLRLLPILTKTKSSRIVMVSSDAHKIARSKDYLHTINEPYSGMYTLHQYGLSKKMNNLFGYKLHTLYHKDNNIFINMLHPGTVQTNLVMKFLEEDLHTILSTKLGDSFADAVVPVMRSIFLSMSRFGFAYDYEQGSLTQVHCASATEIIVNKISGKYFFPIAQEGEFGGTTALDIDPKEMNALWDWTLNQLQRHIDSCSGCSNLPVDFLLKK